MNTKLSKILNIVTTTLECVVGTLIAIAICFSLVGIIMDIPSGSLLSDGSLLLFLQQLIGIVIGIEFLRLMFLHTLDATVELIIIAIVRQLLVEHVSPFEVLILVLSLAILFVIRKFLFIKKIDGLHILKKTEPTENAEDSKS